MRSICKRPPERRLDTIEADIARVLCSHDWPVEVERRLMAAARHVRLAAMTLEREP